MLREIIKPFQYSQSKSVVETALKTSSKEKLNAKNWMDTLKRIWVYLSHSKRRLYLVLMMVILSSSLMLTGPFMVGIAVDKYINTKNSIGLIQLLFGLAGVYLLLSLSIWLQNFWMIGIAQKTVFTMRFELFQHLQKLPIPFFDKRRHGELMSRITNDIENVSATLNSSVIQILSSVLTLVGTLAVMIWLSPLLTLLTLLVVPIMVIGMKWISNRTGKLFKEQQRHLGDLNGYIEETMSGQRVVKTFALEKRVIAEFKYRNERLKYSGFWAQTISGFIPKLMNSLNNMSFAIIAGIGGLMALHHMITIGVIIIFVEYSRQFTRPLNDLANQFNTFLSAVAGAERVFDVLDEEIESKDESHAIELKEVKGDVTFSNVTFSYEKEEGRETIKDLSFHVSPGETLAFVGPTGAGKTTVINLLSRFYDVDSGQICIDGHDITMVKRDSLRRHMAFVLQDSLLFEGTIADNIRYGKLDAADAEIVEAAKQANAHSFIQKFPMQYNTVLQKEGGGISQGQKQLLSIARALLANPTILILDEATSSIDTVTEMYIQEALQRLMKGRTSFVIAHRLNTVLNVDQIIVMNNGGVIERGTHQQLLQKRGFYYELYHSQYKNY